MTMQQYAYLLGIGLIWGSQFVFNELALKSISSISIAASRALIGAITLTLILACSRQGRNQIVDTNSSENSRLWQRFFVIGLFEATLPFVFTAWGQEQVNSGVAAILIGMTPIFTIVLSRILIPGDKFKFGNIISVILGFAGLVVLLSSASSSEKINTVQGQLAILLAALSFALALVLVKLLPELPPILLARNVLLCAAIQLVPISLLIEPTALYRISSEALLSVLFLGSMCGGVAYLLYFTLVQQAGPTFASLSSYLVPVLGVMLGAVFFHERIQLSTLVALAIILLALAATNLRSQNTKN